ncbi:MAG TPA: hypothetical protein VLA89_16915, partial [Gemmatimonadales bacterium]|nr:hypothetical protein [Gemmatimonadales bacterium]
VSHDRALLRALTTRVWALQDGRIQDYGGGFEDWELSNASKQVRQQTVLKEKPSRAEKQQPPSRTQQSITRTARRKAEQAEATVHTLEARVADLEARLADSDFYADPDAAQRADLLFQELETTRKELEQAFAEWTRAAEAMDQR